jgi:hypothetical protein
MTARAALKSAAWAKWLVVGACAAIVAYVTLVPLAFRWQSIRRRPTARGLLRFDNFRAVYPGLELGALCRTRCALPPAR